MACGSTKTIVRLLAGTSCSDWSRGIRECPDRLPPISADATPAQKKAVDDYKKARGGSPAARGPCSRSRS